MTKTFDSLLLWSGLGVDTCGIILFWACFPFLAGDYQVFTHSPKTTRHDPRLQQLELVVLVVGTGAGVPS